jgi:hypothetical protein
MPSNITPALLAERIGMLPDPFAAIPAIPKGLDAEGLEEVFASRRSAAFGKLVSLMKTRPMAVCRREEFQQTLQYCPECGMQITPGQVTIFGAISHNGLGFGLDYTGEIFVHTMDEFLIPVAWTSIVQFTLLHLLTHNKTSAWFIGSRAEVTMAQKQFTRLCSIIENTPA